MAHLCCILLFVAVQKQQQWAGYCRKACLVTARLGKSCVFLPCSRKTWPIFTCLWRYFNLNAALLEADGTNWALSYMRGKLWLNVSNPNMRTVLQSQLSAFPQWCICTIKHHCKNKASFLPAVFELAALLVCMVVAEAEYAWLSFNNIRQGMSWILQTFSVLIISVDRKAIAIDAVVNYFGVFKPISGV